MTNSISSPFLDQVRGAIRVRHYSIRTEQAYLAWIKQFIMFNILHAVTDADFYRLIFADRLRS